MSDAQVKLQTQNLLSSKMAYNLVMREKVFALGVPSVHARLPGNRAWLERLLQPVVPDRALIDLSRTLPCTTQILSQFLTPEPPKGSFPRALFNIRGITQHLYSFGDHLRVNCK